MSTDSIQSVTAQKSYHESMPRLGIEMNTRVHVRLNPMSSQSRAMPGEFLGISHYDFLILRIPSVPGLRNQLLPKTLMEVRFMTDGAINSFYSEITAHVIKPALMVFTTYPDKLTIVEMRQSKRLPCALPVTLTTSYGDALGIIGDLSTGGCRITVELTGQSTFRQLQVDESVVLQFCLSSCGSGIMGTSATVRSIIISGSLLTLGLSFTQPVQEFIVAIEQYLALVESVFT